MLCNTLKKHNTQKAACSSDQSNNQHREAGHLESRVPEKDGDKKKERREQLVPETLVMHSKTHFMENSPSIFFLNH